MGGPALHVAYLSAGLQERGYDTTLVAGTLAQGEESMASVAEELGVPVLTVPELHREISPFRDLRAVYRLASIIREVRPAILHTHTAKAGAIGRIGAIFAGDARPPIVVHTYHGHVLRGYFDPMRSRAFTVLERLLARRTTALVAVSPEVRDDLVALGVAPPERFTVIRLGIGLSERIGIGSETWGAETRRLLGISPGRFVVGWIGRMTGVKRTDDVLVTLQKLRERGVDACLVMVGDGPDREALERRAKQVGIARSVLFLGYQEEVAPYFAAFDAFLLTSLNEGTPVTTIEALAAGVPVVSTRVGGVSDVVREGIDGFLVEPGDTDAMADRLAELAGDLDLRRRMGEGGRDHVQARYSVGRLLDDVDDLYRSLLQHGGNSRFPP